MLIQFYLIDNHKHPKLHLPSFITLLIPTLLSVSTLNLKSNTNMFRLHIRLRQRNGRIRRKEFQEDILVGGGTKTIIFIRVQARRHSKIINIHLLYCTLNTRLLQCTSLFMYIPVAISNNHHAQWRTLLPCIRTEKSLAMLVLAAVTARLSPLAQTGTLYCWVPPLKFSSPKMHVGAYWIPMIGLTKWAVSCGWHQSDPSDKLATVSLTKDHMTYQHKSNIQAMVKRR
ncbi:hypothetical protein TNCT_370071 [Trichonephila clavata]|uniref:Uncharacterized protein n=1 Tax=Trichonephila clavata TaxID=2740835 RepID=A0A8X6HXW9_TRICU|nr:hypothetical protein TNCT_370071 [Trichonephila clavata]